MKTWVFALPINEEIYLWDMELNDYVKVFVDPSWAIGLVKNTNRAISNWKSDTPQGLTPYYPPILKEHNNNGWRGGDILKAKITGLDKKHGVYLLVDWNAKVWKNIESLNTQHVSIGTTSDYKDSKGRLYKTIINELSLTENPRLKNIGRIQDYIGLNLSDSKVKKSLLTLKDSLKLAGFNISTISPGVNNSFISKKDMLSKLSGYDNLARLYDKQVKEKPDLKGAEVMNNEELMALLEELAAKYSMIEEKLAELVAWKMELEAVKEQEAQEDVLEEVVAGEGMEEEEVKLEDISPEELLKKKEDELVMSLAENIQKKALDLAQKRLKGMRLGEIPANLPPKPAQRDKLAEAKAKGLSGMEAIKASLK